ncbi:hypothetical protein ACNHKD_07740 [Methylocystis sp. JAN1]|uniref:hypothetical protein n=1 Tax=Methylocystis sp. JAN1 TaxID=3397211 RepID=UPI003FA3253B
MLALPALLLGLAAAAGTPEEDYIAARDAAIARIKKIEEKKPDADVSKIDRKALADLEKRLQAMIGDLSVKPYPAKGKIGFESLSDDEVGSGGLDGLRFAKGDDGPQVYVTTDGLAVKWIARPEEWWTKKSKTPPGLDEALANDEFYTFAVGEDAALSRTADLPISKPEGATFAHALLGGWAQDIGPNPEQEIIVAVRKDGKIYIAEEKAKNYKLIPACEAMWKESEKKTEALFKKYQASGAKDEKIFNFYTAEQEKGDRDYRNCYSERAPKEAFFPALVKEAQEIADRFGAK